MIEESPRTPPPLPPPDAPSGDEPKIEHELADDQTHDPATAAPAPTLDAKGLVDLLELANGLAVNATATRCKVSTKLPEVQAAMRFDDATRGTLTALAPAALPYVQRWMQDHALVGLLAFGGCASLAIAGNRGAVRACAKPREPQTFAPSKPPPEGQAPNPLKVEGPPPGF